MEQTSHDNINSPNDAAIALLKIANDIVTEFVEKLKEEPEIKENKNVSKLESELTFFSWFALDYWVSKSFDKDVSEAIRNALNNYLEEFVNESQDSQNLIEIINTRLTTYAQIINDKIEDSAKYFNLGTTFANYCEMGHPLLWIAAPEIFTSVLKIIPIIADELSK